MRQFVIQGLFALLLGGSALSQTLIINEVSQGASGNQEYVEFVVADSTAFYDCTGSAPPCIDIRGWIFDDNSGYHGPTGIASGAVRFSNHQLWSCVPLGTIILIYNDADPNSQIPGIDTSNVDGNCSIIAPITSTDLFESNSTTPGAVACSYPATGWTPGGDWSNTLLANGGDCARIVDLAGCEVFSLCWDDNNLNNLIYFPGGATSGNSASNTVYYFNGTDPYDQANWSIGCADVPACGIEEQTPGAPNNAANQAYIAQFNNNCMPIPPMSSNVVLNNDAVCICNGQATASGTGSIPGYTYEWTDASFVPIGQTTPTATNLCAGTYNVIVTSSIGCADTSQVVINNSGNVTITTTSDTICEGEQGTVTATPSAPGGTFDWNPGGGSQSDFSDSPIASTNYTITYTLGSCVVSENAEIVVSTGPTVDAGADVTICEGSEVTLIGTGAASYSWSPSISNGVAFQPGSGSQYYYLTGIDANGCTDVDSVLVNTLVAPVASGASTPNTGSATLNVQFDNLSVGGTSYDWDFGDGQTFSTAGTESVYNEYFNPGVYLVQLTASNGPCSSLWTDTILVVSGAPLVVEVPNVFSPNGDGINDTYNLKVENGASIRAVIVNRWGNTLKELNDLNDAWDGNFNSVPASDGVYFIKYEVVGLDQSVQEGHTFFHLVR